MNKFLRKNRILLLIITILAIIAVIVLLGRSNSTLSDSDRDFAVEDTASVTRIFLAKKDTTQVVLRREIGRGWVLSQEMKASDKAVEILLETLKKMDVKRPVAKTEHNTVVKRLASDGVKVEVYQKKPLFRVFGANFFTKERKTRTFYVGGPTQSNLGTYMVKEGADIPFVVYIPGFRGFLSPRFKAKPDAWRDHTMISENINEIKWVEVRHPENEEQSFRMEKLPGDSLKIIRLHDSSLVYPFDTLKVLDFLSSFYSVKFEDLINEHSARDSVTATEPLHIIRVKDKNGNLSEIKTYLRDASEGLLDVYGDELKHDPDRLYALFNDNEDFALIQYYVFDNLTKTADYFKKPLFIRGNPGAENR